MPIIGLPPVTTNDPDRYVDRIFDEVLSTFSTATTLVTSLQDWRKGRRAEVYDVNGRVTEILQMTGGSAPINRRIVDVALQIEGRQAGPQAGKRSAFARAVERGALIRSIPDLLICADPRKIEIIPRPVVRGASVPTSGPVGSEARRTRHGQTRSCVCRYRRERCVARRNAQIRRPSSFLTSRLCRRVPATSGHKPADRLLHAVTQASQPSAPQWRRNKTPRQVRLSLGAGMSDPAMLHSAF